MGKLKKVGIALVVILLVVIVIGLLFVRSVATRALPDYNQDVTLEGMIDEVVIYRDAYAVPHIFAKNETDLARAVGYCMAQDRLWQMDLLRRACTGQLAEILGEELVETDLLMRSLRIPEKSRLMLSRCDRELIDSAEAFCDGINQYLEKQQGKLPPEFAILRYVPEKWEPEHCIHIVGFMAWGLCAASRHEVVLRRIREDFGEERYRDMLQDLSIHAIPVVPDRAGQLSELEVLTGLAKHSRILEDLGLSVFQASNNWVVSGKKSVTGKPIFANDMHLPVITPGIWYQMHQVVEGKTDVTGVALPGQPAIVCGHNEHIAWGYTNVEVDDLDFYLEKINPENPNQYEFNGTWRDMEVRTEKIKVKGGTVIEKELRFTHRGPIVPEFQKLKDRTISMRWSGNDYSNEARSSFLLSRAKNWDDFTNALSTQMSTSQNVAYADTEGNIGIYVCAGVPIRKAGDGISIVPGWTDEYDWQGFVPFEELPHSYNPDSGFVCSANNKSAGDEYPYYISRWYDLPHRINRIRELLLEKEKLSVEDFRRMQADHRSKLAEMLTADIVAEVGKSDDLSVAEKEALEMLASWDCVLSKTSPAAAIFENFLMSFQDNLFLDEMGEEFYKEFLGAYLLSSYAINNVWRKKQSPWCDDVTTEDKQETFTDMVLKSFKDTVNAMSARYGNNPERWQWGAMHGLVLEHPMGRVWLLDKLFGLNVGPFEVGGSYHTVCPYGELPEAPGKVTFGASQRHIYSLANWDESLSVIPDGNSGIPASEHYCDQTPLYANNEYHSDYVTRDLIEKTAKYRMRIQGR